LLATIPCPVHADAKADTLKLLQTLRLQRQATTRAYSAGDGSAQVESTIKNIHTSDTVTFKFRDAFSFSSHTTSSIASGVPVMLQLDAPETEIRYILPSTTLRWGVTIDPRREMWTVSKGLRGWSFVDFMQVPIGPPNEDALFNDLTGPDLKNVTLVPDGGSLLKMTVTAPPDPRHILSLDQWVVEFDASLGGAMTHLTHTINHRTSTFKDSLDDLQVDWNKDAAGHLLPVDRKYVNTTIDAKKNPHQNTVDIEFSNMTANSPPEADFYYEFLQVRDGAPVSDNIRHTQYRQHVSAHPTTQPVSAPQ